MRWATAHLEQFKLHMVQMGRHIYNADRLVPVVSCKRNIDI